MSIMKSGQEASSSTCRFSYDVFLSFRGKDTRKAFTDHLYTALDAAGFCIFRDDDGLERGEEIKSGLAKAIRESRMSIIVFSKSYASSTWCLDELVMILKRRTYGHVVLPVFYDVDPSEVRKQNGSFRKAFERHEKELKSGAGKQEEELKNKVGAWRAALRDAADLAGMNLKNQADGHEARFIQKIIEVVGVKVSRATLDIAPHLVGIDSQVENDKEKTHNSDYFHRKECVGCHMSSESLQLCTEGLGIESFDKLVENLNDEMCSDLQNKISITRHTTGESRYRPTGRTFPLPISSIGKSGKPRMCFKSYQNEGRFVLNKIRMPTPEFHARREDGRLKLQLCMSDEEVFGDDEEEDELCSDWLNKISITRHTTGELRRSRSTGRTFPPPISSIGKSGKPLVCFESYHNKGRLKIRMPTQEFLRARREDGRLKLQLCMSDEQVFGDDQEEEDVGDDDIF